MVIKLIAPSNKEQFQLCYHSGSEEFEKTELVSNVMWYEKVVESMDSEKLNQPDLQSRSSVRTISRDLQFATDESSVGEEESSPNDQNQLTDMDIVESDTMKQGKAIESAQELQNASSDQSPVTPNEQNEATMMMMMDQNLNTGTSALEETTPALETIPEEENTPEGDHSPSDANEQLQQNQQQAAKTQLQNILEASSSHEDNNQTLEDKEEKSLDESPKEGS